MKKSHVYTPRSITTYILNHLFCGYTFTIKELVNKFDYDKSSLYAIIRNLNYDLEIFYSPFRIVKEKPSLFKMVLIDKDFENKLF